MQILHVIVLSVIIAHHSVLAPHINKTYPPISSLHVRELEIYWCSKDHSWKMRGSPGVEGLEVQLPRKILRFIKQSFLSL